MPMGWVRSLHLAEPLLRQKVGIHCWWVVLLVVFRGVRRFGGRMGREAGGPFGGVRRLRALLLLLLSLGFGVLFWDKTLTM